MLIPPQPIAALNQYLLQVRQACQACCSPRQLSWWSSSLTWQMRANLHLKTAIITTRRWSNLWKSNLWITLTNFSRVLIWRYKMHRRSRSRWLRNKSLNHQGYPHTIQVRSNRLKRRSPRAQTKCHLYTWRREKRKWWTKRQWHHLQPKRQL